MSKWLLLLFGAAALAGQPAATRGESVLSERVAELLVSRVPGNQLEGTRLLEKERGRIIESLLAELASSESRKIQAAAHELSLLFSPWVRGRDSSSRFIGSTQIYDLRRPVERPSSVPDAAAIRDALTQAFSRLLKLAETDRQQHISMADTLEYVAAALIEFADDQTIDWAIEELPKIQSPYIAENVFFLAGSYMGVPPVFHTEVTCGNSSESEMRQFDREQAAKLRTAIHKLSAQWAAFKPMAVEERIAVSIRVWRKTIMPVLQQYSGSYLYEGWLSTQLAPLIRLGIPAVPQLKLQLAQEIDLSQRAIWEYVLAAITGQTDEKIVRELLGGSDPQRKMACEIIAASGQTKWASDLEHLTRVNGYHLDKASQALAACLGKESIPYLERIHAAYPKESTTEFLLSEWKERLQQGEPRRRMGTRQ